MDWLATATQGIQGVQADAAVKDQALKYLAQWLSAAEFAAYRPQLEWLIDARSSGPGLLDRFYQILPFGTGGRRGAVGIGPNRMNLWTLGASVQGHCEYLKERFPGVEPLHVVLAYDVRQFEDKRKSYNPALAQSGAASVVARPSPSHAAGVYAANGIHAHILPPTTAQRYLATPELSFTIRLLQGPRRAQHLRVAQSARRQRRQILRRARRPAGAARRSDHGRSRRSGDGDQVAALGRGGAQRPDAFSR